MATSNVKLRIIKFNALKVMLVCLVSIIVLFASFYIFVFSPEYTLTYSISPNSDNVIQVNMNIQMNNIHPFTCNKYFELYKGEVQPYEQTCTDSNGNKLDFKETDGIIKIDASKAVAIVFSYKVKLGELGKHGYRGQLSNNLMVFDGAETLILPAVTVMGTDKDIKKSIGSISILFNTPEKWLSVVPFAKMNRDNNKSYVYLSSPNWSQLYDLMKSCYAFGEFEKYEYNFDKNSFYIYVDSAAEQSYSKESHNGIEVLYKYYANLFGYEVPGLSVILLRKDPNDNTYLIGGSGSHTIGSSFDPANKRDWELLSHRLFHAFFDSNINIPDLHQAPQLWFYEGLTTYYENMSMDSLPESIKNRLGIDASSNFLSIFKRYIYMNLKDPSLFLFNSPPMSEEKIKESDGKIEFLHYTQAPLIIKLVEDIGYSNNRSRNSILNYILKNKSNQSMKIDDILKTILGQNSNDFEKHYLYGNDLLPLWYMASNMKEDTDTIINQINDYEYLLWTWFKTEYKNYPLDKLTADGLTKLSEDAISKGVYFAPKYIEDEVKNISPVTYQLLKQYALRAKICSVDLSDPLLRIKLLGDEGNIKKWEIYKNQILNKP